MLKFALLGFLNYAPMTGYELEGWINASTANFWHARLSQIYVTLKKMEEDGEVLSHVEPQEARPDRRVYSITDAGRAALHAWIDEPLTEYEVKKDTLLLKLFFTAPANKNAVLTQLQIQLRLHQQKLAQYQQQTPDAIAHLIAAHPQLAQHVVFWNAVRRNGILYEETYIRWLQETIAVIQQEV